MRGRVAMDKFPVCWQGTAVGELTVEKEALYTCFSVRSILPEEGLWSAWLIGANGELRLGILEPDDCAGTIRRRFSDRMVMPLGVFLRGELRPVKPERNVWAPVSKPEEQFRSRRFRKELGNITGVWTKQGESGRWIAVPYDKRKYFPFIDLFCFAEFVNLDGREYLAFCFDREEQIVFGKNEISSERQKPEKN